MEFFKNITEVRKRIEFAKEENLAISKEAAELRLISLTKEMTSTYCPFVKKACLGSSCIHFSKGKVILIPEYEDLDAKYGVVPPKCKLWKG